jgi:hypothetical protein
VFSHAAFFLKKIMAKEKKRCELVSHVRPCLVGLFWRRRNRFEGSTICGYSKTVLALFSPKNGSERLRLLNRLLGSSVAAGEEPSRT